MTEHGTVNPNQALWEQGDFSRIAITMRESGERIVSELDLGPGIEVLEIGCGDGTTALPAARTGARVVGVDIATNLLAAAERRAAQEGLGNLRLLHGDACDLHELEDDAFDLVISMFGAMFAPRPFDVAAEMVRVTRPGGRIVMGNWIPGDPTLVAQLLKTSAAYTPPPPEGFVSPITWGVEASVHERFGAAGIPPERIRCDRRTYTFTLPAPPSAFLAAFRDYYGPTMNAYAAAAAAGRADELHAELEELFTAQNLSPDPTRTHIEATYLRVEVNV